MELIINIHGPATSPTLTNLLNGYALYNKNLRDVPFAEMKDAEKIHLLFPEVTKEIDKDFVRGFLMQMDSENINKTVIHSANPQVLEAFQMYS